MNAKNAIGYGVNLAILPLLLAVSVAASAAGCREGILLETSHGRACAGMWCDDGEVCDPAVAQCVDGKEFCAAVKCGAGERCSRLSGRCEPDPKFEDPCAAVQCEEEGEHCFPGTGKCVGEDADLCKGVTCGANQVCRASDGACADADPCATAKCETWEQCIGGLCISAPCESWYDCPTNMECQYGECRQRSCKQDYQCDMSYPGECVKGKCAVPKCDWAWDCEKAGEECILGQCMVMECAWDDDCEGAMGVCLGGRCFDGECRYSEDCDVQKGEACLALQCLVPTNEECWSDEDCGWEGACVKNMCLNLYY